MTIYIVVRRQVSGELAAHHSAMSAHEFRSTAELEAIRLDDINMAEEKGYSTFIHRVEACELVKEVS